MPNKERLLSFATSYQRHITDWIEAQSPKPRDDAYTLTIRVVMKIQRNGVAFAMTGDDIFKKVAKDLGLKNTIKEWEKYFAD